MATITFDTLKFVERLKAAGISEAQAKAEALVEALGGAQVATARDIEQLRHEIREMKTEILGELKLNRWMLGILLGGVLSLVLKTFF